MAEIQRVDFIDDWDNKPVEMDEVFTARFTVEGVEYKLDLRQANYDRFLKDMHKWTGRAQRVAKSRAKPSTAESRNERKKKLTAVREWANQNGYEVSERGKVPYEILDAYDRAQ